MASDQEIKILSDIEHALKRPQMYIGSTKEETQNFWVLKPDGTFTKDDIKYIPALFKLFCEILDNSIDEHVRGYGNRIDVYVNYDTNEYSFRDYGRGIPLEKHKEAKVPTPQVVFTHLRSGSNFDDTKRETIGMNGVGASLVTIFSEKMTIKVNRRGRLYQQVFSNNLSKISKPEITSSKDKPGTSVTFIPDQKIFTHQLPVELIRKRCLELTVAYPNIEINLTIIHNETNIKETFNCKSFEDFVKKFNTEYKIVEDKKKGMKLAICHNIFTESFEQYSNINGADTFRGGTHIEYMKEVFSTDLREKMKKEFKLETTNADVSKKLLIILFQTWNAPSFEGQTKEKFVNDKKEVTNHFDELFSPRKLTSIINDLPIMKQALVDMINFKNDRKELLDIKKAQKITSKLKIPKLIEASGRDRSVCTLYITEGDSAISNLAMVRDSKTMAGLPLRGKVLNIHGMSPAKVLDNKEIQSLISAIGLRIGEPASLKALNYGNIVIATDQDMDGYCIRCLLINFFYKFWPELFDHGRIFVLESPLYEVIEKKGNPHYFYTKEEFEDFMKNKKSSAYEISYFKGLGSCGKEAWDYMINEKPNMIRISNTKDATKMLTLAFGDDSDARKEWLIL